MTVITSWRRTILIRVSPMVWLLKLMPWYQDALAPAK
jgi:hypothetical protein